MESRKETKETPHIVRRRRLPVDEESPPRAIEAGRIGADRGNGPRSRKTAPPSAFWGVSAVWVRFGG